MPRRKISEYKSKRIIHDILGLPYVGWGVDAKNETATLKRITGYESYVVKVDQAVKGRFKKGLVALDVPKAKLAGTVKEYTEKGYGHFIIEPYVTHETSGERYISLVQSRQGISLSYSAIGGINIETNPGSVQTLIVNDMTDWKRVAKETALSEKQLQLLVKAFKDNFFVFLEINPYIVTAGGVQLLDLAVEVDDAGQSFGVQWTNEDIREPKQKSYPEEVAVYQLDKGSVASFSLSVINPEGSIFLLLSGGGASVVVADEVYNRGFGKELANYGEYSGAPLEHEAKKYTSEVLKLLLASPAPKKVLFIGGAVANFTDIATTFAGVIDALQARAKDLREQNVTVYVRRGGPRQEIGLENMRRALDKMGILGGVYDPSTAITDALGNALEGLKND